MTCVHGMPTPGSCVRCMDDGLLPPPPRPETLVVERTFMASGSEHCDGCNLGVVTGALTARMSDRSARHLRCVTEDEWKASA